MNVEQEPHKDERVYAKKIEEEIAFKLGIGSSDMHDFLQDRIIRTIQKYESAKNS